MRALRAGFTLVELLVAMTLMLLAITITLFATIGTNSLIERTETRAAVVQGVRATVDALRRDTASATVREVKLIKAAAYNPVNQDDNPTFSTIPFGANEEGFAVEIKKFAPADSDNVCEIIGRAELVTESNKTNFFFRPDGTQIALLVYRMNAAGLCEYRLPLYRGTLTTSAVEVGVFTATIVPATYGCGAITCSVGQLRYRLQMQTAEIGARRPAAIDTSGSVALLKEHRNTPPVMVGLTIDPPGPVTLAIGGTQIFRVWAGYSDSSTVEVTTTATVAATGGSYNQGTKTYTAGSTAGTYELRATYSGFTAVASIRIETVGGTRTITNVIVSPPSVCIGYGTQISFSAMARYSDNSFEDVTASSLFSILPTATGSITANTYTARSNDYTDRVMATFSGVSSNVVTVDVRSSCGGPADL